MAFAAIVVLLFLVLTYARTGTLRGEKFRLYVVVPDANAVLKGTDVWLNGQRVGTVVGIDFAPAASPLDARVVITTEILSKMREHIRRDSRADLRSGGTIIGAPVVYLSAGTAGAPAILPGDTLRAAGKSDFEIAASRATEALTEVPGIMADAKILMANAKSSGSRLSGILRAGGPSSFVEQTGALRRKLSGSSGSFGRLTRDDAFRGRIARTMAASDTLRTFLSARMDELGRFRRDSSLARSVRMLRDDVDSLRKLSTDPRGTVGRVTMDSALTRSLDSLRAELTTLITDIKKNPLRYTRVF